MAIKVDKIPDEVNVEDMVVKSVRGVTADGITIFEDELQLRIHNKGTKTYSMLDCNVEYRNSNNKFLGFDSDGFFNDLKPNENCLVSVPLVVPEGTESKNLTIKVFEAENYFSKYGKWGILVGLIVVILIDWFLT
jgi:hypothetical protein